MSFLGLFLFFRSMGYGTCCVTQSTAPKCFWGPVNVCVCLYACAHACICMCVRPAVRSCWLVTIVLWWAFEVAFITHVATWLSWISSQMGFHLEILTLCLGSLSAWRLKFHSCFMIIGIQFLFGLKHTFFQLSARILLRVPLESWPSVQVGWRTFLFHFVKNQHFVLTIEPEHKIIQAMQWCHCILSKVTAAMPGKVKTNRDWWGCVLVLIDIANQLHQRAK